MESLYIAAGAETYSTGGYSPTNSRRSLYKAVFKPYDWLSISSKGSRLSPHTEDIEEAQYFSETNLNCFVMLSDTEILSRIVRVSSLFYVDDVSEEIAGVNLLGYQVQPSLESFSFGIKQHFFKRLIYLAGFNSTATSMIADKDLVHLYQENASQFEFGWKVTQASSLAIQGRNTHYTILNNPDLEEIVDHMISGKFRLAF